VKTTTHTTRTETSPTESTERMEHETSRETPPVMWNSLGEFSIVYPAADGLPDPVPQVKVFANGRQQVRLRVKLSPRLNGVYVQVPCKQLLKSMTLVTWHGGGILPSDWVVETVSNGYTYDPAVISEATKDGAEPITYALHDNAPEGCEHGTGHVLVDVFVTTTASTDSPLRIAASITPPDDSAAYTTADGGEFDSSVNIHPRPPLRPVASDFITDWGPKYSNQYLTMRGIYITLMYGGRSIKLLEALGEECNEGWHVNTFADEGDWSRREAGLNFDPTADWEGLFTAYIGNGGKELMFSDIPDKLDWRNVSALVDPIRDYRESAINYVQHLFSFNAHFSWTNPPSEPPDQHTRKVIFVDEYGNQHKVEVGHQHGYTNWDFDVFATW
jgi:hypothetical protein